MADNPELESFRQQWRDEVSRRSKPGPTPPVVADPQLTQVPPTHHEASHRNLKDLEEGPTAVDTDELAEQVEQLSVKPEKEHEEDGFTRKDRLEPRTALEHFERAVEKEAAGNLGASLDYYRKAYRLDDNVDKAYRNKHFAHVWKPAQPAASGQGPAPLPAPAPVEVNILPTNELVESFACLPILQAEPLIEDTPPPPCPIARMPSEVITEILKHVALQDPATFGRVALVCKQLAYHFYNDQPTWKLICQNPEFGFAGMQYVFACSLSGNTSYKLDDLDGGKYTLFPKGQQVEIPEPLSTWRHVFQSYPRIRFTGIYISTVNYTRPGGQSLNQMATWNAPIHIVTYYRYLRFYPDGSVISLLTTTEPVDVVPHITKENLKAARMPAHRHRRRISDRDQPVSGEADAVPTVAMNALKHGHRGRWRLSTPESLREHPNSQLYLEGPESARESADPRDLVIETEGVSSKYVYLMHLSLRSPSASKSGVNHSQNTKLAWRGFWSYNKMTDDWGEFGLRNDRHFVFRRVRGWGL